MFCTYFHALTKRSEMHPNTTNCTETLVWGPMRWIRCVHCKKSKRDIMAWTFALIAPVQFVLQQVKCGYETIPNAPKYYKTDRNNSLGSNGVDGVHWLWKITTRLRGTNFCINCTSSVCFATSFVKLRNDPKCTQILQNAPKHWYRVQWGWIGCFRCEKSRCDFVARTFAIIALVHPVLHRVLCSYETMPNAPKYCETDWNICLGSTRLDWVCLLRKIPSWLRGINFCINCTSSPRFAPSFMLLRNDPKWTQTLWNAPKHEFNVQWGGSGAFVAKNYNVTSWGELLY